MTTLTRLLAEVGIIERWQAGHQPGVAAGDDPPLHGVVTGGEWLTAENHGARLAASDLTLTPSYVFTQGPYRGTLIGTSSWSRGRTSRPMRYTRSGDYLYLVERNIQPEGSVAPVVLSRYSLAGVADAAQRWLSESSVNTMVDCWTDGTTLYLAGTGYSNENLVATFALATGVPGSSYTGSRLPQPAGAQLRGIWGDGTTIWICWVSARTPGATTNIWAYTAATFARDSSKDITPAVTAADDRAGHPSGRLWGEALTLPTPRTIVYMLTAAGGNDLGVVAYDLSDGNAVQPDLGLTHFGLTTSNQVADVEGFDLVPGMGNERLARLYINNPALPGTAQLQAYRLTRVGLRLERSDNLGDVVIDGLPEFPSNDPNIVRAIYEAFRRGDTGR